MSICAVVDYFTMREKTGQKGSFRDPRRLARSLSSLVQRHVTPYVTSLLRAAAFLFARCDLFGRQIHTLYHEKIQE